MEARKIFRFKLKTQQHTRPQALRYYIHHQLQVVHDGVEKSIKRSAAGGRAALQQRPTQLQQRNVQAFDESSYAKAKSCLSAGGVHAFGAAHPPSPAPLPSHQP